jgi:lambda repressor-like predicted transcriptional regulator
VRDQTQDEKEVKAMSPREIKAQLILKGIKIVNIAANLDVSHVAVTRVISGKSVSGRIRLAIANAIGKKVNEIWPGKAA